MPRRPREEPIPDDIDDETAEYDDEDDFTEAELEELWELLDDFPDLDYMDNLLDLDEGDFYESE